MSAAQIGLMVVGVAGTAYVLAVTYRGYAEARLCLANACLKWQRFFINRDLAKHGIAHDQVLPALMQLDSFSFERGEQICTFRRGADGTFDVVPRKDAETQPQEEKS